MKIIFYFFSLMIVTPGLACQCDEYERLNKQICSTYDAIFLGEVLAVEPCDEEKSSVMFEVKELYKGVLSKKTSLSFSCGQEDCAVDFQEQSEWLIFSYKNNAQEQVFDFCSYSRTLLSDSLANKYQNEVRGSSFFEDQHFLSTNFEVNAAFKQGLKPRKYEKVDPALIPVFLGISLFFMIVGAFVMKKVGKS